MTPAKVKYPYAFVKACKAKDIWYKGELLVLLSDHGMQDYFDSKIRDIPMRRWYPSEVFEALEGRWYPPVPLE